MLFYIKWVFRILLFSFLDKRCHVSDNFCVFPWKQFRIYKILAADKFSSKSWTFKLNYIVQSTFKRETFGHLPWSNYVSESKDLIITRHITIMLSKLRFNIIKVLKVLKYGVEVPIREQVYCFFRHTNIALESSSQKLYCTTYSFESSIWSANTIYISIKVLQWY